MLALPCGKECPHTAHSGPLLPAGYKRRRLPDAERAHGVSVFLREAQRVAHACRIEKLLGLLAVGAGLCGKQLDFLLSLRGRLSGGRILLLNAAVRQLRRADVIRSAVLEFLCLAVVPVLHGPVIAGDAAVDLGFFSANGADRLLAREIPVVLQTEYVGDSV